MYNEWVDNAIKVGQGIEQLQSQKMEIERRIGILQAMAKQLIEEGADTYYRQRTFPLGRNHFNRFMYMLIKIVKEKRAIEQLKEVS